MSQTSEPLLRIESLHKRFDENVVLNGASLDVPRGSLVTVLGRSGTGKSVLLKCLAGIVTPDAGRIRFDGKDLDASTRADFRRRCSFLFQSNALFDSLTALENVGLPLEQTTSLSDAEIRQRSLEALKQLELEEHAQRYPSQLSGGMQKRLALARAIVTKPELVLFDEPTAGLDPLRRNAVFTMILKYQRQFRFTAVVVTHDLDEALIASDRVALLDGGQMRFEGPPADFTTSTDSVVTSFRDSAKALRASVAELRASV
ncbi:MAG: ATP-binding cassette domain-containing protein [Verrucomicrobiaceae bacterium]